MYLGCEVASLAKVVDELTSLDDAAVHIIALDGEHKGGRAVTHHVRLKTHTPCTTE